MDNCEWSVINTFERGVRYAIDCDGSTQAWWIVRFYEPKFCPYCGKVIKFVDKLESQETVGRRTVRRGERVFVSPWTEVPDTSGKCWMRFIEGTDPGVIANRVAFIERYARVRVCEWTDYEDAKNWFFGPKEVDGTSQRLRDWCDEHLVELGYSLSKEQQNGDRA